VASSASLRAADSAPLLETMKKAAGLLRAAGLPFALAGGGAAYARGAAPPVHDVDFAILEEDATGITVLEGSGVVLSVPGGRLGIAGTKGFGAGFPGRCGSDFGEPEMKAFVRHSRRLAEGLSRGLRGLDADIRVALTHYAPVADTLAGEPPEIHPFLGSYFLAEAIDSAGADLAVHGHAHAGQECGVTPGGTSVRNVALPVLRRAYALYVLGEGPNGRRATATSSSHRR
jgi:hypothetical protein